MQTTNDFLTKEYNNMRMTIPQSLSPKKIMPAPVETLDLMKFVSSQHPLINVWLVFSFISIGILSVLLYII